MICPDCNHDNLPGADVCADCGQDLTALDTPGGRTELESQLTQRPVADLSPKAPICVPPEATVAEAIARMSERRIGAVLVGSPDDLRGILSERDVLLRFGNRYEAVRDFPVTEFMTPNPETIDAEAPIAFALHKMHAGDFRHLPVERDGNLVGMVSLRDVVRLLAETFPDLIPSA